MQSFEDVYKQYFKRVYAFLYKLTSDHDVAEEMVQETFYRAFVSFHKYDGSCEMFTWLAAIAKNVFFIFMLSTLYCKITVTALCPERMCRRSCRRILTQAHLTCARSQ